VHCVVIFVDNCINYAILYLSYNIYIYYDVHALVDVTYAIYTGLLMSKYGLSTTYFKTKVPNYRYIVNNPAFKCNNYLYLAVSV